jgi:hypothetical protein
VTELTDEQVFGPGGPQKEMTDEEVFGRSLEPPTAGEAIPEAFLDRVRAGQALGRILSAAGHEAKEGAVGQTPTGYSDERLGHMIDIGVFHDPVKGRPGPIQMANEAVLFPIAQAWQSVTGAINAGIHGAGGAVEQLVTEFGGSQGTAQRAKNEVINASNWAMIEGGMGRFSRPAATPEGVMDQTIGGLPKPEDFTNAAKVLEPPKYRLVEREISGKDPASIDHEYDIVDPSGAKVGKIHSVIIGDRASIENIDTEGGPNAIGPSGMRDLLRQFREENPNVKSLEGRRVSGARFGGEDVTYQGGGTDIEVPLGGHIEQNLRRMWKEDGIHPAEAVHDAQTDAFIKHDITAPREVDFPDTASEVAKGLTYDRAREIAQQARDTETADVAKVFGGDQAKAAEYQKQFGRMMSENDAVSESARQKLGDMTKDMSKSQLNDLEREFPTEQTQNWWLQVADTIAQHTSTDPAMLSKNLAHALEDTPKHADWSKMTDREKLAVVAANKVVQDADALGVSMADVLKKIPARMRERFGSGEDAEMMIKDAVESLEAQRQKAEIPKLMSPEDFEVLTETGGKPGSLSAAITPLEMIPLDVQPASPPGRLVAAFKDAADTLLDIGRDAQMLVAPMARGTNASMAIAKNFANTMRRNRWDWDRIDTDIAKRFTPEQRARMWSAADEESTSLQLKEPAHMREHQGFATLEPAERAAVEDMQTRAQNTWERAKDVGMVKGESLPAYTPRMVMNIGTAFADDKALPLNVIGNNLKIRTAQMMRRKHMTVEETEQAAKDYVGMRQALKGKSAEEIQAAIDQVAVVRDIRTLPMATAKLEDAIAGRTLINNIKKYGESTGADTVVEGAIPAGSDTKWFTLDHPAFRTWRPKLAEVEGKFQAVKDAEGNAIFEQVPLYVHGDFEGPLRAVLSQSSGALYGGMMALKGKTMSMIMNSPMIHNAVEWGRALPAMPGKVATFKVYFEGNRAKNNPAIMHEAIDNGLVPIGHRFFNQDISGLMEAPDMTPGRSWTAKLAAAVPGLFDEAAGVAVKRAIDKAGDFWHNTLLWDRVADLQMGLYVNMRADAIAKGIDPQTSARMAAHWANRYAGALPKEAMSDAATKVSNMLMFSRSFTMGNLGVIKDVLTGLPKDVLAQVERDMGTVDPKAVGYAKSMARRKAMGVVVADMALLYIGNSLMQNVMNVMINDSTLDKELHGYAQRFQAKMQAVREHPLDLIQPLRLLGDLGATSENEPGKGERIHVGDAANGTAIYMRQPAGKIGEEFVGYMTGPLDMMRKKLGTIARPAWQIMSNDAGFGRKVYDPDADTPGKYLKNLGLIAAHLAKSQFPEGQIGAFADLVKGEGDKKVNALQAFGPFGGVTFSKGAPGGPAVGEMYASRAQHEFQVNQALPDIRRQIQRGDVDGAVNRMTELDIPQGLQRFYIKTTLNPATRLSPRAVKDFYLHSTPEQRARFERAQQAPPPQ